MGIHNSVWYGRKYERLWWRDHPSLHIRRPGRVEQGDYIEGYKQNYDEDGTREMSNFLNLPEGEEDDSG